VPEAQLAAWGQRVEEWLDVDAILAIARAAPVLGDTVVTPVAQEAARCRIGLAYDEAFHFYYDDNLRRLEQLGAELVRFSPIRDVRLPDVDGLYLGGGYPEVHAAALADNQAMRAEVAAFAAAGGPIYAECGGLMYLARAIVGLDGSRHPMVGLVPGEAHMQDRLVALGYVEVETQEPTLLGGAGLRFRGHQFRYSELRLDGEVDCVYTLRRRRGGEVTREGYRLGSVLASYVHAHWASNPLAAKGFVAACAKARR
jgi:cobyrinic acid a,c-diamide synthase